MHALSVSFFASKLLYSIVFPGKTAANRDFTNALQICRYIYLAFCSLFVDHFYRQINEKTAEPTIQATCHH